MQSAKLNHSKSNSGVTTMELAVSLPIFIAVTMFSINLTAFVFAADFCDRACKDCARAAGQMPTPDQAVNAMNAAAANHPVDNLLFQQLTPELLVYQDYNNSSKTPTPAYGTTSDYNASNGANNITPARDSKDLQTFVEKKSNLKRDRLPNNIYKTADIDIKDIDAVLADPNQNLTPGPYVVVRTSMLMHIPISISLFGIKLFGGNVEDNPQLFQFHSLYTYPITNTYVAL
jgi:Flp pilus assembly protein TadG